MLLKTKYAQENHSKQSNNEANKVKKSKQSKKKIPLALNINSLASLTSKRIHKTSKSTIEPNDNRLFNSPIVSYGMKDALPTNSVSFTHILQQNLKNHQYSHNMDASIPSSVTNFQINQMPYSQQKKESCSGFSNSSLRRQKSISQSKRSIEGHSKSPHRFVNPNRISNTPKLKQCKGEKEKTFKQLLQNKQNQQIKLQCSQKLFKYLENKDNKIIPERNLFCGSAKSNLLSTCAINLSQRCEHQKIPSLVRSSKGNISNKSVVDLSSNHQIKQFFQEDDEEDTIQATINDKVIYLKNKINSSNQFMKEMSSQSENFDLLSLLTQSNKKIHNNPQEIEALNLLKQQIVKKSQEIITKVTDFSKKSIKQIDYYISISEDCQITSIDWMAIQQKLSLSDKLMTMQLENEVLMERLREFEDQLKEGSKQKDETKAIKRWQAQLYDINSKITIINHTHQIEQNVIKHKKEPLQDFQEQFLKLLHMIQQVNFYKK